MKKALTVGLLSGLLVFAVPQAVFADHAPGHSGEGAKSEQSAEPQPDSGAKPEGQPPPDQPYADRENRGDEEEDFLLF